VSRRRRVVSLVKKAAMGEWKNFLRILYSVHAARRKVQKKVKGGGELNYCEF
jgi:hypothetical protein